MRTCGQSWSRQHAHEEPAVWVLDLRTATDRTVQRLWPDTLRRYMNEARKYYIPFAGLQELIKNTPPAVAGDAGQT